MREASRRGAGSLAGFVLIAAGFWIAWSGWADHAAANRSAESFRRSRAEFIHGYEAAKGRPMPETVPWIPTTIDWIAANAWKGYALVATGLVLCGTFALVRDGRHRC